MTTIKKDILSVSDIDLLKSKGFEQNDSKHSGFYFKEDDNKTFVIIPYSDHSYKIEFYEMVDDGEGCFYDDYDKEYSKKDQSFEDFINSWFDDV